MTKTYSLLAALVTLLLAPAVQAADGFELADTAGDHIDVKLDGKVAARYMYAHDTSTKERRVETYKPYLHVFDAAGEQPITNGAGARQFPHHRGIYIGWNKITFNGKSYDLWHMPKSEIVHQKFENQKADNESATFTSVTQWNDEAGMAILVEERTMAFRRGPSPARLVIDFTSKLTAPNGNVQLGGDPEHAGVHFRPVEAEDKADYGHTSYVFPKENADPKADLDYPWVGQMFVRDGKHYSVVHMNHPDNPKNTRYSAYRDYGRFGAFPTAAVKSGESITFRYRFLIADGDMPEAGVIQKTWDEFAGAKDSPVPTLTVKGGKTQGVGKKSEAPKPTDAKPGAK
jgi:hypothetical protein